MRIWSAGHGARPLETFLELLAGARVEVCVDIRTAPYSQRHPHFSGAPLAASLRERGIGYEHRKALGGWRRSPASSPHAALKEPGFRGYADHLSHPEFRQAYAALRALASERRVAFLCSETLWWKCHRRILADRLVADGWEVLHLVRPGSEPEAHRLWDLARLTSDGRLVYDQGELALFRDP
jgi:uncharacterized protein (DUF488 family)